MNRAKEQITADELERIDEADDLHISPFREDGVTYGTLTWIWAVIMDGDLYVRAYSGTSSSWYKAAIRQKAGRIHAAGMVKEVNFEPITDTEINSRIDAAYEKKYSKSPYMAHMTDNRAKSTTIRIIPTR
jgi:hypothetical protein